MTDILDKSHPVFPKYTAFKESLEDYLDDQPWWQNTYWPIWRFFNNYGPRALYMEAKYFIQRGRRGYSDRDLWNLNDHIARQVLAFLDSNRMSVPFGMSEKESLKRETEIRWLMEEHLNQWGEDGAITTGRWSDPAYRKRVERANRLFGKYWMSMWD